MKKLIALLIALIMGIFSTTVSTADTVTVDCPTETKIYEWAVAYSKRCRKYRGKVMPRNWTPVKQFARRVALAPLSLLIGTASAEGTVLDGVEFLNEGNPSSLGSEEGSLFTVSPSTAKKRRGYWTNIKVKLTKFEKRMAGVVVGQNRGMIKSSSRPVAGDVVIPSLKDMNIIIVDEKSRSLYPTEDAENKIGWKGNGEHKIKDVASDGLAIHFFCTTKGKLAVNFWFKIAKFLYGCKGMFMPGLMTDVNTEVKDHWGVMRTITLGNTILMNSSLIKGLNAYNSLEELIEHAEMWGLTRIEKQWQSGDHKVERRRIMGTQPNSTNLEQTDEEITELLKPEALQIWSMKFRRITWMMKANIKTARGRAFAARPELIEKDLIMNELNNKAGNAFLRNCQGKFMAKGSYLKMYQDRLFYSLVYVHGMDINDAAKKAAETGLHGEIRVNPSFAGRTFAKDENGDYIKDENGHRVVEYTEETHVDEKGRYIETALVRYPHGAASETIVVKAYLDETVPDDVIMFPAPVADEKGNIPVKFLYALRLQGADFDGDAVTAFIEKIWLEAQKRNTGKSYMIIPINTESTEKDTTKVCDTVEEQTDDVVEFETFFQMKVESLTNRVGLIATSMKYFFSQFAPALKSGCNPERDAAVIVDHACAMGDDIDEYKHGKANNDLQPFVVHCEDRDVYLTAPYFNRYARKYKSAEDFEKACKDKDGNERVPGKGILDTYARIFEKLMAKAGLPIIAKVAKASDGKYRWYFTVEPVKWQSKDVDLFVGHGEGQTEVALPPQLEEMYGIEPGTKFSAKSLFQMLYKDHSATVKTLIGSVDTEEDRDALIKVAHKINERYILATATVVAWTKKMVLVKRNEEISTVDALKLYTTLMTQHTSKTRSPIDTMCSLGTVTLADGTTYERSEFSALRTYNYFLDICGDGLFLSEVHEAKFPTVQEDTLKIANVTAPDLEEAKANALKQLQMVDKIVSIVPYGVEAIEDAIDISEFDREEDASVLNDGTDGWFGDDQGLDLDNLDPDEFAID